MAVSSLVLDEKMVGKLKDLIRLDIDAVHGYTQAIDGIDAGHVEIRQRLTEFRGDHERHIQDLAALLRAAGHEAPEHKRDFKGFLIEGMTAVRSAMGTEGALKAMRTNEVLTNRKYEDALLMALPADVEAVVKKNREDERRHLEYIESALAGRVWEYGAHPAT